MIKKALLALAIAGTMAAAQATPNVVVNEGFDNVFGLAANGWILTNASTPGGTALGFTQGFTDSGITALSGDVTSYAGAGYGSAAAGGALADWLITPVFNTASGAIVTFWLNAAQADGFTDAIKYGFIDAAGTLNDAMLTSVSSITTGEWTKYTAVLGYTAGTGRFAIEYTGAADQSNYIGVDNLSVQVPEPSSIAILAAGLMGLGAVRRRQKRG